MDKEITQIKGGAFQIARKMFESELWTSKPSSWKIIWIYILGRVSHKSNTVCERGEGFFQWNKDISQIGIDITPDNIKKASSYFRRMKMISTRRSTRGVYIKVLKYNEYQTLDSYTSTAPSTKKALEKHSDIQECKNVKNVYIYSSNFEEFWNSYPKKVAKPKAYIEWKKLSEEEYTKIKEDIPKRKLDRKWVEGFIKDPERYLKYKQWEDDITKAKQDELKVENGKYNNIKKITIKQ